SDLSPRWPSRQSGATNCRQNRTNCRNRGLLPSPGNRWSCYPQNDQLLLGLHLDREDHISALSGPLVPCRTEIHTCVPPNGQRRRNQGTLSSRPVSATDLALSCSHNTAAFEVGRHLIGGRRSPAGVRD